jgi:CubicO group peptidase (beta-lactamase class C family)
MRHPLILRSAVVFAFLFLPFFCVGAQVPDDTFQRVEELLRPYDGTHRPGFAVGVVMDGRLVYKKGFGMANLDHDVPNTPRTVFRIVFERNDGGEITGFAVVVPGNRVAGVSFEKRRQP